MGLANPDVIKPASLYALMSAIVSRTDALLSFSHPIMNILHMAGKMVCTGSKSEEMARKAVKTVVEQLREGKIKIKNDATVTIQNIVASINLGGTIHLERQQEPYPEACMNLNSFRD